MQGLQLSSARKVMTAKLLRGVKRDSQIARHYFVAQGQKAFLEKTPRLGENDPNAGRGPRKQNIDTVRLRHGRPGHHGLESDRVQQVSVPTMILVYCTVVYE
jgi:hypothetical protein